MTKHNMPTFGGKPLFSSYKTAVKQQLNGEKWHVGGCFPAFGDVVVVSGVLLQSAVLFWYSDILQQNLALMR